MAEIKTPKKLIEVALPLDDIEEMEEMDDGDEDDDPFYP